MINFGNLLTTCSCGMRTVYEAISNLIRCNNKLAFCFSSITLNNYLSGLTSGKANPLRAAWWTCSCTFRSATTTWTSTDTTELSRISYETRRSCRCGVISPRTVIWEPFWLTRNRIIVPDDICAKGFDYFFVQMNHLSVKLHHGNALITHGLLKKTVFFSHDVFTSCILEKWGSRAKNQYDVALQQHSFAGTLTFTICRR